MSVYSMTGFASALVPLPAAAAPHGSPEVVLSFEAKSVNSRFLDLTIRLPDEWRQFEPAIRSAVSARVRRGKVEVRLGFSSAAHPYAADELSVRALQRLVMQQDQVRVWLPQAPLLSVSDAIRLAQGVGALAPKLSPEVLSDVCQAGLDAFAQTRAQEGSRLAERIQAGVAELRRLAEAARPLVPQAVADLQRRFVERFRQAVATLAPGGTGQATSIEERALSEAASFAIRIDVAEELDRLTVHLDEVIETLGRGKDAGKRLDFLAQELHREANTLGSKSTSIELSRIAMDMKIIIEQIREQVQNIE